MSSATASSQARGITLNLTQRAVERLVERQPAFMSYTPSNVEAIVEALNKDHVYAVLHKKRHKYSPSPFELELPRLSGVFYMDPHERIPDRYFASTFKLLKSTKFVSTARENVNVTYSYSYYSCNAKSPEAVAELRELASVASSFGVSVAGSTIGQIKSELQKLNIKV